MENKSEWRRKNWKKRKNYLPYRECQNENVFSFYLCFMFINIRFNFFYFYFLLFSIHSYKRLSFSLLRLFFWISAVWNDAKHICKRTQNWFNIYSQKFSVFFFVLHFSIFLSPSTSSQSITCFSHISFHSMLHGFVVCAGNPVPSVERHCQNVYVVRCLRSWDRGFSQTAKQNGGWVCVRECVRFCEPQMGAINWVMPWRRIHISHKYIYRRIEGGKQREGILSIFFSPKQFLSVHSLIRWMKLLIQKLLYK